MEQVWGSGAPRGAPGRVCDEGPCVLVVRDSVRGDVGWCPQRCCSEGNRGLGLVLFCACRRVWHIYHFRDADKIRDFLNKVGKLFFMQFGGVGRGNVFLILIVLKL